MFRSVELNTEPPAATVVARDEAATWSDARVFPLLIAALLVLDGLLQNPYWVPAGDSELYTAAARSMAQG